MLLNGRRKETLQSEEVSPLKSEGVAFGVLWALLILKLFRISLPVVDSPLVGWPLHLVGAKSQNSDAQALYWSE